MDEPIFKLAVTDTLMSELNQHIGSINHVYIGEMFDQLYQLENQYPQGADIKLKIEQAQTAFNNGHIHDTYRTLETYHQAVKTAEWQPH